MRKRKRRRIAAKRSYLSQHAISELMKRFLSMRGNFGCFETVFSVIMKKSPGYILKFLLFLSLSYSADFRDPVLYFFQHFFFVSLFGKIN